MARGIGSYIKMSDRRFLESLKKTGICMYCGGYNQLSIEHIEPLSKSRDSSLGNLTIACKRCNSLKWDYLIDEFFERIYTKREVVYNRQLSNIIRLRLCKSDTLKSLLIDKIIFYRNEHSYFTSIIRSISENTYRLELTEPQCN